MNVRNWVYLVAAVLLVIVGCFGLLSIVSIIGYLLVPEVTPWYWLFLLPSR